MVASAKESRFLEFLCFDISKKRWAPIFKPQPKEKEKKGHICKALFGKQGGSKRNLIVRVDNLNDIPEREKTPQFWKSLVHKTGKKEGSVQIKNHMPKFYRIWGTSTRIGMGLRLEWGWGPEIRFAKNLAFVAYGQYTNAWIGIFVCLTLCAGFPLIKGG